MGIWQLVFFPPEGERHSPFDFIADLSDRKAQVQIIERLRVLQQLEITDWPHTKKHTGKLFQLTARKYRVMFCLDNRMIVVLHVFKKQGQKTRKQDINRAQTHYDWYLSQKEGE